MDFTTITNRGVFFNTWVILLLLFRCLELHFMAKTSKSEKGILGGKKYC